MSLQSRESQGRLASARGCQGRGRVRIFGRNYRPSEAMVSNDDMTGEVAQFSRKRVEDGLAVAEGDEAGGVEAGAEVPDPRVARPGRVGLRSPCDGSDGCSSPTGCVSVYCWG